MADRRAYTDAEVDAAVQALADPDRFDEAQRIVAEHAPALQGILNQALEEANWFDIAHQQQVLEAAGKADIEDRLQAVRVLLAEETRVSMLIGVAVGYELAHELENRGEAAAPSCRPELENLGGAVAAPRPSANKEETQ